MTESITPSEPHAKTALFFSDGEHVIAAWNAGLQPIHWHSALEAASSRFGWPAAPTPEVRTQAWDTMMQSDDFTFGHIVINSQHSTWIYNRPLPPLTEPSHIITIGRMPGQWNTFHEHDDNEDVNTLLLRSWAEIHDSYAGTDHLTRVQPVLRKEFLEDYTMPTMMPVPRYQVMGWLPAALYDGSSPTPKTPENAAQYTVIDRWKPLPLKETTAPHLPEDDKTGLTSTAQILRYQDALKRFDGVSVKIERFDRHFVHYQNAWEYQAPHGLLFVRELTHTPAFELSPDKWAQTPEIVQVLHDQQSRALKTSPVSPAPMSPPMPRPSSTSKPDGMRL